MADATGSFDCDSHSVIVIGPVLELAFGVVEPQPAISRTLSAAPAA
jgi:hypothetical protein